MAIAVTCAPSKGLAMAEKQDYEALIKQKFQKINLSDGVSKDEAIVIAQNYLLENEFGKNCILKSAKVFAEDDPYWDKNSWHVTFNLKLSKKLKTGLKWTVVNVDKKTGDARSGGEGPS